MGVTVDGPLLDLFRALAARGDDTSERALLVRGERHGAGFAANIVLKHADTFATQGGSDQDEFRPAMNALLLDAPGAGRTVPANILYRLDSRGAAGLWEWICVLYQPDDASIKDKMQFGNTRTALLAALGERDLLDIQAPGSFSDVSFPTKLRNARKVDYQNPQQSTAGKSAAQAAGTGTGSLRRNFRPVAPATRAASKDVEISPKPSLSAASASAQNSPAKPASAPVAEPESIEPESESVKPESVKPAETAESPVPALESTNAAVPAPTPARPEPVSPEPVADADPATAPEPEPTDAPSLDVAQPTESVVSSNSIAGTPSGEMEPDPTPVAEDSEVVPLARTPNLDKVEEELGALQVGDAKASMVETEEGAPALDRNEKPSISSPTAPIEAHADGEVPVEEATMEEAPPGTDPTPAAAPEKDDTIPAPEPAPEPEPEPEPAPKHEPEPVPASKHEPEPAPKPTPEPTARTMPEPPLVFGAPRPASPKKPVQEVVGESAAAPSDELQPPPVFGAPKPASPRKPIDDPFGPVPKSDIAVGMGQGETHEEEDEAVRKAEAQERADQTAQAAASSAPGIAALGVGVSVDPDADEAVRALPHSPENTVILSLHGEALGLASAPQSATPTELQGLLAVPEPRLSFYRFTPQVFLYVYSCPSGTPVRQRMLYSVSVMPLLAAARAHLGLVKKVEVTDIEDLTPDVLQEAADSLRPPTQEETPVVLDEADVIDSIDEPAGGAATLAAPVSARPRRPGRH